MAVGFGQGLCSHLNLNQLACGWSRSRPACTSMVRLEKFRRSVSRASDDRREQQPKPETGGTFEDFVAERDELRSRRTKRSGAKESTSQRPSSNAGKQVQSLKFKSATRWSRSDSSQESSSNVGGGGTRKATRNWQGKGDQSAQHHKRNSHGRGNRNKWARSKHGWDHQDDGDVRDKWDDSYTSSTAQLRDNIVGELVYGVAPVLGALKAKRREAYKLYVQEQLEPNKRKDASAVDQAIGASKELGIEVEYVTKHDLNMVVDNRPHQGLALDCTPLDYVPLDKLPKAPGIDSTTQHVWLVLDEIMDPHNLGAILRSAYFLGAAGVVVSAKNSAPLSPVVSKVSSGVVEFMPVHSCVKLPQFLMGSQEDGWTVVGASNAGGALPCKDFKPKKSVVLVVGNEGYGLRTTVQRSCEALVKIEDRMLHDGDLNLDSLNVSVATGILLHSILNTLNEGVNDCSD